MSQNGLSNSAIVMLLVTLAIFAVSSFVIVSPMVPLPKLLDDLGFPFGRYAEREAIRRLFEEIEGVKVIEIVGNEDITFEDICAEIQIEGKGCMEFVGLTKDAFDSPDYISLFSIGGHFFHIQGRHFAKFWVMETGEEDEELTDFDAWSINIGKDGVFQDFFDGGYQSLREVIENYDEILSRIDSFPGCPEKRSILLENGEEYHFCVSKERFYY